MPEWIGQALELAKPFWSAVAQICVIWYFGQVFKKRVWTKEAASKGAFSKFMRDTIVVHPFIAGVLWGAAFPWMPAVEFVTTRGGAINQGLITAFITLAGHTLLEAVAEARGWTSVLKVLRETVPERDSFRPGSIAGFEGSADIKPKDAV